MRRQDRSSTVMASFASHWSRSAHPSHRDSTDGKIRKQEIVRAFFGACTSRAMNSGILAERPLIDIPIQVEPLGTRLPDRPAIGGWRGIITRLLDCRSLTGLTRTTRAKMVM